MEFCCCLKSVKKNIYFAFYRTLATALQLSVIGQNVLKGRCINFVFKFILNILNVVIVAVRDIDMNKTHVVTGEADLKGYVLRSFSSCP